MLDPKEAPRGYKAVKMPSALSGCVECAFMMRGCPVESCLLTQRKDKTAVYFVKDDTLKTVINQLRKTLAKSRKEENHVV